MKTTSALMSLCLILSISRQSSCQENITVIYAVRKEVRSKVFNGGTRAKTFTQFNDFITGLSIYNDHLYFLKKNSVVWRAKVLTNSSSFKINQTSWEEFKIPNTTRVDLLSLDVAEGHVYVGRSDGVVSRCSTGNSSSCEDFILLKNEEGVRPKIAEVEYNPRDGRIYVVLSFLNPKDGRMLHQLWHCTTSTSPYCDKVTLELKGWARLETGLDALWIADLGKIIKCPYNQNGTFAVSYQSCDMFHRFEKSLFTNVAASKNYLYVRLEARKRDYGNYFWRCNPDVVNSCTQVTGELVLRKMGPYIFV